MVEDKCPHCNAVKCIPAQAYAYVRKNGQGTFRVTCKFCGASLQVSLEPSVIVTAIAGYLKEGVAQDFVTRPCSMP